MARLVDKNSVIRPISINFLVLSDTFLELSRNNFDARASQSVWCLSKYATTILVELPNGVFLVLVQTYVTDVQIFNRVCGQGSFCHHNNTMRNSMPSTPSLGEPAPDVFVDFLRGKG